MNKMGASTSRLRRLFSHAIQVTSLSTAFNLALVADGVRPSYKINPNDVSSVQKLIDLYGAKVLAIKGDGLIVSTNQNHQHSEWPDSPDSTLGSLTTSLDSHLYYHLDAYIICRDKKTKTESGAIFYSFEAPEPLSHTSQTAVYHAMVKTFALARRLSSSSDEGVALRVDLADHKVLSPSTVHSLLHGKMDDMGASIDLLILYLKANGFGPVADILQVKPHLLTSEAFRKGVLMPILSFESSGMLSSLKLSHVKREELCAETKTWANTLLSSISYTL